MVILHSEFDICMPWFAIKTGQKIFRYHKLYDIIYIIYYEKIRMYIYIYYISVPLIFKKKMLFWWISPNPISNPKIDMSLGGRGSAWVVKFRWENSSPRGYSPSLGHRHALGEIWGWFFPGRLFRETNGAITDPWGCMVHLHAFTYMNGWIFYGKLVGKCM